MSTTVQQIKDKLNIADVIGQFIKVDSVGGNFKAKCPFHNEKTPSFFISPERGSYYCFGCGAKGDMFTFVQEYEKIDFKEALKELADKAGVKIENNFEKGNDRDRLFEATKEAMLFFEGNLSRNQKELEYLKGRGLTEKTISDWQIGLSQSGWNSLEVHLKNKKFGTIELEKAGLIKKGNKGYYDRFRNRIMFPLFDAMGRAVGFSGRIIEGATDAQASAKYLNSPDTELFNKSELLYGFHKAKTGIREKGYAILVEGQLDLLMMHQLGFNQTVATSGTALTLEQLALIKRSSNNLLIVYDGDTAGINAAVRAWSLGLQSGMDVKIVTLPDGNDPADLAIKNQELLKTSLRNSKHVIDFVLDNLMAKKQKESLDDRKLAQAVEQEVLPYVVMITSKIDQSYFVSRIAEKANIREDALWQELERLRSGAPPVHRNEETPRNDMNSAESLDPIIRRILGIIFTQQEKDKDIATALTQIFSDIVGTTNAQTYISKGSGQKEAMMFEAEMYHESVGFEKEIGELFNLLKEEQLKKQFEDSMAALHKAEEMKDTDNIAELLKKCHELSVQLRSLQAHTHIK